MDKRMLKEMAKYLIQGGAGKEKIFYYLRASNGKVDEAEISELVEEVARQRKRNVTEVVNLFASSTMEWFMLRDLYNECNITPEEKGAVRVALYNLVKDGTLEHDHKIDGKYRLKKYKLDVIDWKSTDVGNTWDIKFPFKLHDLLYLYPQNIVIFAGEKNCGKTAMANAIVKHNMADHKIRLINSEAAGEEIKARRQAHTDITIDDWKDEVVECNHHYADKILKDHINVVDYLEISGGEFFLVADEIRKIYEAIGKGLAIIFIQKAKGAEFGRGKEFSTEKARLVCNLSNGNPRSCFVQMVKNSKVQPNPSGLRIFYKVINNGSQLVEISRESFGVEALTSPDEIKKYNKEVQDAKSA